MAARGELPAGVGWRIVMHNRIPLARGLGSSAAATVAGVVAGNALLGDPLAQPSSSASRARSRAIRTTPRRAARRLHVSAVRPPRRRGGHPLRRCRATCARCCSSRTCACRPSEMRAVLPNRSRSADAVANLGAVALGVAGSRPAATTCSRFLTVDRLHEPYRAAAYPQLPPLIAAAREAGAPRRLPVRRGLDDPRLRRLDGGHHPHRGGLRRRRRRPRPARPGGGRRAAFNIGAKVVSRELIGRRAVAG